MIPTVPFLPILSRLHCNNSIDMLRHQLWRFFHNTQLAPLRWVRQSRRRANIQRMIDSGEFKPNPGEPNLSDDYARPSPSESIPKVFHYTWKTRNLPSFYARCLSSIVEFHPPGSWRHKIWVDADIDEFVSQRYPQYKQAFDCLPKMIMKVDVLRYMIMHSEGGVYSDLDVIMYKPIDNLIADCRLLLPLEADSGADAQFIAQHFLASVPGHPFWIRLIEAILVHPLDEIRAYADPIVATGPSKITKVWRQMNDQTIAKMPRRVYICPPSDYLDLPVALPEKTICIHACTGTWRDQGVAI